MLETVSELDAAKGFAVSAGKEAVIRSVDKPGFVLKECFRTLKVSRRRRIIPHKISKLLTGLRL